jgi:hypothetical protein
MRYVTVINEVSGFLQEAIKHRDMKKKFTFFEISFALLLMFDVFHLHHLFSSSMTFSDAQFNETMCETSNGSTKSPAFYSRKTRGIIKLFDFKQSRYKKLWSQQIK